MFIMASSVLSAALVRCVYLVKLQCKAWCLSDWLSDFDGKMRCGVKFVLSRFDIAYTLMK